MMRTTPQMLPVPVRITHLLGYGWEVVQVADVNARNQSQMAQVISPASRLAQKSQRRVDQPYTTLYAPPIGTAVYTVQKEGPGFAFTQTDDIWALPDGEVWSTKGGYRLA